MGYLAHLRYCNRHDLSDMVPWFVAGNHVGYLSAPLARRLDAFPRVFSVGADAVAMADGLSGAEGRTRALDEVLERLRAEGFTGEHRDEQYAVCSRIGGPELLRLDRGAAETFGILCTGFHLNGVCGNGEGMRMWIARRSRNKTTFPGSLDNMVAGGQPAGLSVAANLVKECHEEADIPADIVANARPAGAISYMMSVPGGLRRHVMYVYDLTLPDGFTPRPLDGEVEDFSRLPVRDVGETVRTSLHAFKYNCNLVIIDFLIRRGFITPDDPDYVELVTGLRVPVT